jgi:hypothetical protein
MSEMRALSIMQPWVNAITHGDKRVENRSWRAPEWVIGKRIALHASKGFDRDAGFPDGKDAMWQPPQHLPLGAVVASAAIIGCHPMHHECDPAGAWAPVCSPWAVWGQCHWLLGDVHALPDPIPCRGALGLWKLPEDVERAMRRQLDAVCSLLWGMEDGDE